MALRSGTCIKCVQGLQEMQHLAEAGSEDAGRGQTGAEIESCLIQLLRCRAVCLGLRQPVKDGKAGEGLPAVT